MVFSRVRVAISLVFCVVLCISLFYPYVLAIVLSVLLYGFCVPPLVSIHFSNGYVNELGNPLCVYML
jgi:hypothetical protein